MIIYHYNPETGEYMGQGEARESPLEPGVFLIPAYSTSEKPPKTGDNEVAVFENEKWAIKPDFRGKVYYRKDTKEEIEITEIGVEPDEDMTDIEPGVFDEWDNESKKWKCNLDLVKPIKIQEIKNEANRIITTRYDYYKQININELQGYSQKEKEEMWDFINSIREQSKSKVRAIQEMSDKQDILNYKIHFNKEASLIK